MNDETATTAVRGGTRAPVPFEVRPPSGRSVAAYSMKSTRDASPSSPPATASPS